jgi:hypothetical protein
MAISISALNSNHVEHGIILDISVYDDNGNPWTYHISNCATKIYRPDPAQPGTNIEYFPYAGFLDAGEIQGNLQNTANEIAIGISAIPAQYIDTVLGHAIKGGTLRIYRVFFDTQTQTVVNNGIHQRFVGYITNFAVQEDIELSGALGTVVHTLTLTASSIIGILDHKITGRRTNESSWQYQYDDMGSAILTDLSMGRVEALKNAQFDFGKKV